MLWGGGNISIHATGDISNLAVATPSVGKQVGGTTFAESQVEISGGGDIEITTDANIRGGTYFSGKGNVHLNAANSITQGNNGLYPVFGAADTQIKVSAFQDAGIERVVNPTFSTC